MAKKTGSGSACAIHEQTLYAEVRQLPPPATETPGAVQYALAFRYTAELRAQSPEALAAFLQKLPRVFLGRAARVTAVSLAGLPAALQPADNPRVVPPADDHSANALFAALRETLHLRLSNGDYRLIPPAELPPSAATSAALSISYTIPPGIPNGVVCRGTAFSDMPCIFSDGALDAADHWIPCIEKHRFCTSPWRIVVHTPRNLLALASGALVETKDCADGSVLYTYEFPTPVPPRVIGLAIAPFDLLGDPHNSRLVYACMPGRIDQLRHTARNVAGLALGYLENELLHCDFPFPSLQIAFVRDPAVSVGSFAGLALVSDKYLFGPDCLNPGEMVKERIAVAVAAQFFNVLPATSKMSNAWVLIGLAEWAGMKFIEKHLGVNWCKYRVAQMNEEITEKIPWTAPVSTSKSALHPAELQNRRFRTKCFLLMRMIEQKVGAENFVSAVRAFLMDVPIEKVQPSAEDGDAERLPQISVKARSVNADTFFQLVNAVAHSLPPKFVECFINGCGLPPLTCGYSIVPKKPMSFGIRADHAELYATKFSNPDVEMLLQVINDEGPVGYPIRVNAPYIHSQFNIKASRKKKSTANSAEEEETTNIKWARLDPDYTFIRSIHMLQPVRTWIRQLRDCKDVFSQYDSLKALRTVANKEDALEPLSAFLDNSAEVFWPILEQCLFTIASIKGGFKVLMDYYKRTFADKTDDNAHGYQPRTNKMDSYPRYRLRCAFPRALACCKDDNDLTLPDVLRELVFILENNDNSSCPYSDCFIISNLIDAIGCCKVSADSYDMGELKDILVRYLRFDGIIPSYNNVVSVAALKALGKLYGPEANEILWQFARVDSGYVHNIRKAALKGLLLADPVNNFAPVVQCLVAETSSSVIASIIKFIHRGFDITAFADLTEKNTEASVNANKALCQLLTSDIVVEHLSIAGRAIDLYIHLYGSFEPQFYSEASGSAEYASLDESMDDVGKTEAKTEENDEDLLGGGDDKDDFDEFGLGGDDDDDEFGLATKRQKLDTEDM